MLNFDLTLMPDDPKKTKFADEERTKLQSAVSNLAKENQALKDRLTAVHKEIDRVVKNPTAGEKLKTMFLPKKQEPLEKLGKQVREINEALASNQKQRDEAVSKLDALTKAEQPKVKSGVGQNGGPTRTTVAESLKQKSGGPKPTPQESVSEQVGPTGVSQQGLPQSQVSSVPYTPYLEPEKPQKKVPQVDPLRGQGSSTDYTPYLEPEKSPKVSRKDPLRGQGSPSDYAPHLEPEKSPGFSREDPLRGPTSSVDYTPYLPPDKTPKVPKEDPLRGEQSSSDYTVYEEPEEQSVEVDPLRGPQTPGGYTVYEEPGQQEEVGVDPLRNASNYVVYEPDEQDQELPGPQQEVSQGQQGPEVQDSRFKMKPMGDRYVKGEKEAPKKKVQVGGQEVEVHQKEWLREVHNEKMRKEGGKEISQEEWDRRGLSSKQAMTQYLNEEQRASHKVNIEGGVLKGSDGQKLTGGDERIFVMDGQGQLYAQKDNTLQKDANGKAVHMHHSSFLSGEAVAGAGELRVGPEGQLKEVTDRSGHYKPGQEQTKQTLEEIERQGASLDNVKFTMDRDVEKTGGMAREYLQGQVTPEEQQHRAQRQEAGQKVSDTSQVMEKTFKDRHNVVDQIKAKGENVRSALKKTGNLERIEKEQQQGLTDRVKQEGVGKIRR